jgi:hypothetical protein
MFEEDSCMILNLHVPISVAGDHVVNNRGDWN